MTTNKHPAEDFEGVRFICKCECGGAVMGIEQFGRTFSYCDKCSPVVKLNKKAQQEITDHLGLAE